MDPIFILNINKKKYKYYIVNFSQKLIMRYLKQEKSCPNNKN